jgi:SAM-dependent methyltransferase
VGPEDVVRAGYDRIADRYLEWGARVEGDPRGRFLDELLARLQDGARVLDLGCGAGVPSTKRLAETCEVVGVDISPEQLARARANVPRATYICADIAELDPPGRYDAVTAFYSVSHLPRVRHATLFRRVASWLRPGGWFLAALGAGDSPDLVEDWLGVDMFFSSFDAKTNRRLLEDAGLQLVVDEVVAMREPEGEVEFLWILARKPAAILAGWRSPSPRPT